MAERRWVGFFQQRETPRRGARAQTADLIHGPAQAKASRSRRTPEASQHERAARETRVLGCLCIASNGLGALRGSHRIIVFFVVVVVVFMMRIIYE